MAAVPIIYQCMVYPRNKTVPPYPATIVGLASIAGLEVGGGPIKPPPDIPVEPPLVIWPNPPEGIAPIPGHPIALPGDPWWPTEPPPEKPPEGPVQKPHEGWNWSVAQSGWYYLYVPGKDQAQPKGGRR